MQSSLSWLREHIGEPLTLADLARYEHLGERTLVQSFRQATGISVFEWITRERMARSKALLETTDFRVGEIAAMVGFRTAETLRRNFVKVVGITVGA